MNILGINAYHGNSSAAVVCDGRLVAAVEEERFNRVKNAAGFPAHAVQYCLAEAGLTIAEIDHIAIPRDPWARLGTKLLYALQMPRFALERSRVLTRFSGIHEELAAVFGVGSETIKSEFHRVEHHVAHLASAFFVSPFDQAAVLSADGLGDFASTMWAKGQGNRLKVQGAVSFPHSLGLYYTAISQYIGFRKYGDEYKVMGLAAYGEPAYQDEFREILQANGHPFRLGLKYFCHHQTGPQMTWADSGKTPMLGQLYSPYLEERLGRARTSTEAVEKKHKDVAASLQLALEEAYFRLLNSLQLQTGLSTVCLAGGVAFNCVANGRIFDHTPFSNVYVQPAAGDAGLAVGAAYYVYHQILGRPRCFVMDHAYWGPQFTSKAIGEALKRSQAAGPGFSIRELPREELASVTAQRIAAGKIVGWFHGRAEWGPRALGNRSIVVDPRRAEMKETLNRRIKHRESFRPFAPSILEEATAEYFEHSHPSPFMNLAYSVRLEKRGVIPAPTHVDGTGRLQTVSRGTNPGYWALIKEFEKVTGVPVLLNTSFNDNEPIVLKPEEAIDCFLRSKMDVLVIGDQIVEKQEAYE